MDLESLAFNDQGLIPAIVQDRLTGGIRMMAWMNREALAQTLSTGWATFFSRSRQKLWVKGETSGHRIRVREILADCDGDTLLLLSNPSGPSCHTGEATCFFTRLDEAGSNGDPRDPGAALPRLAMTIAKRSAAGGARSYTKHLLDAGAPKIAEKVREEAREFGEALMGETTDRVASEAADVLYHLLVGLEATRRFLAGSYRSARRAEAAKAGSRKRPLARDEVSALQEPSARESVPSRLQVV